MKYLILLSFLFISCTKPVEERFNQFTEYERMTNRYIGRNIWIEGVQGNLCASYFDKVTLDHVKVIFSKKECKNNKELKFWYVILNIGKRY